MTKAIPCHPIWLKLANYCFSLTSFLGLVRETGKGEGRRDKGEAGEGRGGKWRDGRARKRGGRGTRPEEGPGE
jgi:hypothetical protein